MHSEWQAPGVKIPEKQRQDITRTSIDWTYKMSSLPLGKKKKKNFSTYVIFKLNTTKLGVTTHRFGDVAEQLPVKWVQSD